MRVALITVQSFFWPFLLFSVFHGLAVCMYRCLLFSPPSLSRQLWCIVRFSLIYFVYSNNNNNNKKLKIAKKNNNNNNNQNKNKRKKRRKKKSPSSNPQMKFLTLMAKLKQSLRRVFFFFFFFSRFLYIYKMLCIHIWTILLCARNSNRGPKRWLFWRSYCYINESCWQMAEEWSEESETSHAFTHVHMRARYRCPLWSRCLKENKFIYKQLPPVHSHTRSQKTSNVFFFFFFPFLMINFFRFQMRSPSSTYFWFLFSFSISSSIFNSSSFVIVKSLVWI